MEIVVAGRRTEVTARYRAHLTSKLAKVEQLAPRAQRVEVLVSHESNPRQAGTSERVELTVVDRPVIRAEASADDQYAALDLALAKLVERLRRTRDRRRERRKDLAVPPAEPAVEPDVAQELPPADDEPVAHTLGDGTTQTLLGDSPVVIREKVHQAAPMTIDDALYQMELIGHDFFLFVDAKTGRPAVAYRRHGWSYGVIMLDTVPAPDPDAG
ncbi:MAG: ribosome-associated translation inhibitor RaiA [Micrococcales bacterium]|nr:ribosome-associated translation inhibitor RaiA [Micrococcales bacterium]